MKQRLSMILCFFGLLLSASAFPQSELVLDDEALKLAAIEGLIAAPPKRALPILKKVLGGKHSVPLKKRALFVLGQINLPEARKLLLKTANGKQAELQQEAIRAIGISGHPASLENLSDIYRNGNETQKTSVLEAYLIANDRQAVYALAVDTVSADEFDHIVKILGAMGASEELQALAKQNRPTAGLINAYAISGDLDSLLPLARGDNLELAQQAINAIGIVGGTRGKQALVDIYNDSDVLSIKQAVMNGLMIAGDDQAILRLYQQSTNLEEKQALLRILTVMDSDVLLKAIDAALEE